MTAGRSFVVIGAGGHAKVVIATVEAAGGAVVRVLDDNPTLRGQSLLGHVVDGCIDDYAPSEALVVIAVGSNRVRRQLAKRLNVSFGTIVHPSAIVHASVQLGVGTVVFAGAVLQPGVRTGKHVIVNTRATVDHDSVLGDYVHVGPGASLAGSVHLEEGAFMGVGSCAIPGVQIGAWATIGAGSVVLRAVPPDVVAVGVPARLLGGDRP